ncbi:MAG: tetratricopeptide repeat protein [Ignavibacteriales bacterium]|nr:tetratricopeptide repeat protein [Ignavibacteriales bacterium]
MRIIIYMIALLAIVSCSKKNDSTLYNEGKIAEEKKDFQTAAQLYEEAIDRFQTTAYAESSLLRLSFMYNNDMKDSRKAIQSYHRFITLFPASKHTPTMLFLSGFVYNNELHLLDSAKIAYENFLQKYPEHELAASAKFELETLGKDPGQAFGTETTALSTDNKTGKK